jgi:hypothetical protein
MMSDKTSCEDCLYFLYIKSPNLLFVQNIEIPKNIHLVGTGP